MIRTMVPAAISKVRTERTPWVSACSLALVLALGFWPIPAAARSHAHAPKVKSHSTTHRKSSHAAVRHPADDHHREAHRAHPHGRVRHASYRVHSSRRHQAVRGQQGISQERTLEIQRALIRQHYLAAGQDSGQWDQATRDALMRFQGDNHWQTKILPDSRALIKLGLGPSRENLLNPESAAIGMPGWPSIANAGQASGVNANQAVAN